MGDHWGQLGFPPAGDPLRDCVGHPRGEKAVEFIHHLSSITGLGGTPESVTPPAFLAFAT